MGNAFLKQAKRMDIKQFLQEASSENGLKYRAEKGARHLIYIPFREVDDEGQKRNEVISISARLHEWTANDGKFKSTVCTKGEIITDEQGNQLTDGSCAFCDRVDDSWAIYNYRYSEEERTCGKTGEDLKKHMENVKGQLARERKTSKPKDVIYILIAQFKVTSGSNGVQPVLKDGLPVYEMKVMKLSAARVEKITKQLENNGASIEGCELIFEYDDTDDLKVMVGQCAIAPVFPANMLTTKFPDVKAAIDVEVSKFTWDGLEKAFPEWEGMSTVAAGNIVTGMFKQWDEYTTELKINPNARYGEYLLPDNSQGNPSLDGTVGAPQIAGGVSMPTMAQMGAMPGMTAEPAQGAPVTQGAPMQMPNMGVPGSVPFAGAGNITL